MNEENLTTDPAVLDGSKLWDEIFKAIVSAMPHQIFPVIKEAYGREYPKETPITFLATEHSTYQKNKGKKPSSTFMDLNLLVDERDIYHFECQMKNDKKMSIRMFSYDVSTAVAHGTKIDEEAGEITLRFPSSVVVYPKKNKAIPDTLRLKLIFSDHTEHIYEIPTIKIQSYSIQEIREKHLDFFIPFIILRLEPKLRKDIKKPLTADELTAFVQEAILVLNEELKDHYITEQEQKDYIALFLMAADHVLRDHDELREEVHNMLETKIKLPSVRIQELEEEIADQKEQIADKDAKIQHLEELLSRLTAEKQN
ncbi:MAG: hypothetical protein J1E61_10280 [Lachnospiraceae bacterium]|nr:hypothetical protein [Lachnospiraceae bacterium]